MVRPGAGRERQPTCTGELPPYTAPLARARGGAPLATARRGRRLSAGVPTRMHPVALLRAEAGGGERCEGQGRGEEAGRACTRGVCAQGAGWLGGQAGGPWASARGMVRNGPDASCEADLGAGRARARARWDGCRLSLFSSERPKWRRTSHCPARACGTAATNRPLSHCDWVVGPPCQRGARRRRRRGGRRHAPKSANSSNCMSDESWRTQR